MNYDFQKTLFCRICNRDTAHDFVFVDIYDSQVFYTCSCGVCIEKQGVDFKSTSGTMSIERWIRKGEEK